MVAHIAHEPLPNNELRRKINVFLSAPPGDGLRNARDYFKEYIKPILVAGAVDYEVIEGRREGDIRAKLAEQIRKRRFEASEKQVDPDESVVALNHVRKTLGIHDEPATKGDLVIGRNTWKEYIRGLHEGWLGPLDPPPQPEPETVPDTEPQPTPTAADDASPKSAEQQPSESKPKKPEEKHDKPKAVTPAYISPSEYSSQPLPPSIPSAFDPSSPIVFPHILGFLNTPIRIYRFLRKRYLADAVGEQVTAFVLASNTRPYQNNASNPNSSDADADPSPQSPEPDSSAISSNPKSYEQQHLLESEEQEWPKSVRNPDNSSDTREHEWLDDVVVDPRINTRMFRFVLSSTDSSRASRIAAGEEWVLGQGTKPAEPPIWERLWKKYGWEKDHPTQHVIVGNLDGEDRE